MLQDQESPQQLPGADVTDIVEAQGEPFERPLSRSERLDVLRKLAAHPARTADHIPEHILKRFADLAIAAFAKLKLTAQAYGTGLTVEARQALKRIKR